MKYRIDSSIIVIKHLYEASVKRVYMILLRDENFDQFN